MVRIKIQAQSLEDLQSILEDGVSLIAHVFKTYRDIIEAGGELTVAQEKALTSHITCLYQTNKDYRATKREIEREMAALDESELKKIIGLTSEETEISTGLTHSKILDITKKN